MTQPSNLVSRNCEFCKEEFVTNIYEIARGKGRFCSLSCGSKFGASLRPQGKSESKKRERARKIYIERHGEPVCRCGKLADVHHKDGNAENNTDENHEPLCRSCHATRHNRTDTGVILFSGGAETAN